MLSEKSKKEIEKMLSEITKKLDKVDKARDKIEPFWRWEIDGVVEDVVRHIVSPGKYKFFEACKFKAKALIFTKWKINEWDKKYKRFVSLCIREKNLKYFEETPPYFSDTSLHYFPPFEAAEFENLLFQSKACLDCFAKAIGSLFEKNPPRKFNSLEAILSSYAKTDKKASEILSIVQENGNRLRGIVLNPIQKKSSKSGKQENKSIRDLITHYEKMPIGFPIFKSKRGKLTTGQGAQVMMRHPQMVRLHNYSAVTVAGNVWYYTSEMIKKSFQAAFPNEIKSGYIKKVKELKKQK